MSDTPYVLKGRAEIAKYMGVSTKTITRWHQGWDFPASPLPNGQLVTTVGLVRA